MILEKKNISDLLIDSQVNSKIRDLLAYFLKSLITFQRINII